MVPPGTFSGLDPQPVDPRPGPSRDTDGALERHGVKDSFFSSPETLHSTHRVVPETPTNGRAHLSFRPLSSGSPPGRLGGPQNGLWVPESKATTHSARVTETHSTHSGLWSHGRGGRQGFPYRGPGKHWEVTRALLPRKGVRSKGTPEGLGVPHPSQTRGGPVTPGVGSSRPAGGGEVRVRKEGSPSLRTSNTKGSPTKNRRQCLTSPPRSLPLLWLLGGGRSVPISVFGGRVRCRTEYTGTDEGPSRAGRWEGWGPGAEGVT